MSPFSAVPITNRVAMGAAFRAVSALPVHSNRMSYEKRLTTAPAGMTSAAINWDPRW